jgi:Uma2 family endonuclease
MATLSPKRKKRTFEEIAPDAVFELLSPSDDLPTLQAKCQEYIDTGSGVAVLRNPRDRSVALYRKGCDPLVFRDAGAVTIGPEMPNFILDARAVFEASEQTP